MERVAESTAECTGVEKLPPDTRGGGLALPQFPETRDLS